MDYLKEIYLSSAYMPPVQYYSKFVVGHDVFIDPFENYIKQTYRNRCTILSSNGAISLSIPVEHSGKEKLAMKDIRISSHGNWQHVHWNAIVSAYNSSPFFEYFEDDFYPFYHRKFDFLFDFNERINRLIVELLCIDKEHIRYTEQFENGYEMDQLDLRKLISPKTDFHLTDPNFKKVPYYQVFRNKFGFVDNLSIMDLLFNMGNESQIVLHNTVL